MAGIRCLPSSTWLHPTHTSHFFKRSFFGRISIGQIPSWSHLCSGLQSSRALSIAVAASSTVKAQNGTVRILMQSDVHEVAIDMRQHFDPCFDLLEHVDIHHPNLCDDDGWILENPMGIRTEREIHAQSEGAKIYRRMYEKR